MERASRRCNVYGKGRASGSDSEGDEYVDYEDFSADSQLKTMYSAPDATGMRKRRVFERKSRTRSRSLKSDRKKRRSRVRQGSWSRVSTRDKKSVARPTSQRGTPRRYRSRSPFGYSGSTDKRDPRWLRRGRAPSPPFSRRPANMSVKSFREQMMMHYSKFFKHIVTPNEVWPIKNCTVQPLYTQI